MLLSLLLALGLALSKSLVRSATRWLWIYVSHLLRRGQTTCFSTYDISQMNRRMQSTIHTTHDHITSSMFACMFLYIVHNYKPTRNSHIKFAVVHNMNVCCHQCRHHHRHHLSSSFTLAHTLCHSKPHNNIHRKLSVADSDQLFNVIQIMTLILYAEVMKILLRLSICNNNHSLTRTVMKKKTSKLDIRRLYWAEITVKPKTWQVKSFRFIEPTMLQIGSEESSNNFKNTSAHPDAMGSNRMWRSGLRATGRNNEWISHWIEWQAKQMLKLTQCGSNSDVFIINKGNSRNGKKKKTYGQSGKLKIKTI